MQLRSYGQEACESIFYLKIEIAPNKPFLGIETDSHVKEIYLHNYLISEQNAT